MSARRTRRAFTRSPAVPPAHQACSAGPPERPQGAWPVAIVDGFAGVAATVIGVLRREKARPAVSEVAMVAGRGRRAAELQWEYYGTR